MDQPYEVISSCDALEYILSLLLPHLSGVQDIRLPGQCPQSLIDFVVQLPSKST